MAARARNSFRYWLCIGVPECLRWRGSIHVVADGEGAFLFADGQDFDLADLTQRTDMGAAAGVGGQFAETYLPLLARHVQVARFIRLDPLFQGLLDGACLHGFRLLAAAERDTAFPWPVMGLERFPALALAVVADQMTGGVQARMQRTSLGIDPGPGRSLGERAIDMVRYTFGGLQNTQHLAFADPAGVEGLAAALGVEGSGAEGYDEALFMGCAGKHFDLAGQFVAIEKKALGHGSNLHQAVGCQYKKAAGV